jgi:GH15 family glucan-1,4-alpha-glucosidase
MHKIKDYYLVGNLQSAALVSKSASIDWLCFPYFDSPSVFARILGKNGGTFSVLNNNFESSSKYVRHTAIAEFKFKTKSKNKSKNSIFSFTLLDFMLPLPVEKASNFYLVRKLKGTKGNSEVKFLYSPKPDFGKLKAKIIYEQNKLAFSILNDTVILHLPEGTSVKKRKDGFVIKIGLKKGEEKELVLEYCLNSKQSKLDNIDFLAHTQNFWNEWIKRGKYFDFYEEELERSMITLKLMQFYPTGAIIAAPTTSLPVDYGGVRNWDYRYVWVRDATFTMFAFHVLNCNEEGEMFFQFIKKIVDKENQKKLEINTTYTIWGENGPNETFVKSLQGYKNSKPIRLGNNASSQLQLDVYGALIDAHYFMHIKKKKNPEEIKENKELIMALTENIERLWNKKDGGIWEMRKGLYNYAYSKVMAWVGIDRALKMSDVLELNEKEINKLTKLRKEIHDWIWNNCFDKKQQNIVQHSDTKYVDASNFLFILVHFLDKDDDMTKLIVKNTAKKLSKKEVLIYRYLMDDGLKGTDKGFLLCSFWYISALAITGQTKKSEKLFKKLMKHFNKQFLIPEQMGPQEFNYLGNYPQALSHLGFVMAAYYINEYKKGDEST